MFSSLKLSKFKYFLHFPQLLCSLQKYYCFLSPLPAAAAVAHQTQYEQDEEGDDDRQDDDVEQGELPLPGGGGGGGEGDDAAGKATARRTGGQALGGASGAKVVDHWNFA